MSDEISAIPADETKTFVDLVQDYYATTVGSEAKTKIIKELTNKAQSSEEWDTIFCVAPLGSELETRTIAERVKLAKILKSKDEAIQRLVDLYSYVSDESELAKQIIAEIVQLANTQESWELVKLYVRWGKLKAIATEQIAKFKQ